MKKGSPVSTSSADWTCLLAKSPTFSRKLRLVVSANFAEEIPPLELLNARIMNRITLSFLFFSISLSMNSQDFPAPGAEWEYRTEGGWSLGGGATMKYVGDTIYNGILKKKIHVHLVHTTVLNEVITSEFFRYLSQSGDSIFRHYGINSVGEYAFKTNYEVGETTYFNTVASNASPFLVENLDTLWVGNQLIKRYEMKYDEPPSSGFTYVYDLFGPEPGFIVRWWESGVDGTSYFLECYQDNNLPLTSIGNNICVNSTSEHIPTPVFIFPNPVSQHIEIHGLPENMKYAELLIFNTLGKIVLTQKMENIDASMKIEVAQLSVGSYWGMAVASGTVTPFRFIKQ